MKIIGGAATKKCIFCECSKFMQLIDQPCICFLLRAILLPTTLALRLILASGLVVRIRLTIKTVFKHNNNFLNSLQHYLKNYFGLLRWMLYYVGLIVNVTILYWMLLLLNQY